MNLEPNNKSLSFAEFLDAAIRDKAEAKPFPYTLEVCRCRYCSFCQNGKCALKRCCCMNERVKARSCTFAELLRDCFANFKDNVFQFRLRIACERATELHTCFLDAGHRARFYEGVSYMRKKDPKFIAQLFRYVRKNGRSATSAENCSSTSLARMKRAMIPNASNKQVRAVRL